MTKQEVIKILKLIKSTVFLGNRKFLDALDRAIELLAQPEPCEDAVSRNLVLSEVKSGLIRTIDGEDWKRVSENVRDIKAMPCVTPKMRTGKWIVHYECPKCGEITREMTECCLFCGAKMGGAE